MTDRALLKGWRWVRFGDVVRQVKDTSKDPESLGLNRIVGLSHLDSKSLPLKRWDELDELPEGTSFTRIFRSGHVLFGKRRAYQRKVALADFDGLCSGDILVFETSSEDLQPDFLPYIVQSDSFFDHALGTSAGSLSPRTKWQELAKYEFALPSPNHQRHIVEVLRTIEACLLATKQLGHALTGTAESIVSAAEDQALDWISLDDLLLEPPRNGLTIQPTAHETGSWSLTVGSMSEHGYSPHGCRPIEPPSNAERYMVRPGDLFVTRSNTVERVGLPARVPPDTPAPLYYSDLLMRLRPDEHRMPAELLEHVLRGQRARTFVRSIAAGTSASMKKINARNLRRLPLPLLPDGYTDYTVSRLSLLDAARNRQTAHTEATQSLLSRTRETLLSGRSDV